MSKNTLRGFIVILVSVLLGAGIAIAGGSSGLVHEAFPIFYWCTLLAFVIQWVAFVPAYLLQSERFYDLTGSLTYIAVTLCAITLDTQAGVGDWLLGGMVCLWAARLGSFLFTRIMQDGSDDRFDEIKPNFVRFLATWTLQGTWVVITSAAALTAITSKQVVTLNILVYLGALVWFVGWMIEVIADRQKRQFRRNHDRTHFINTGLWSRSRHPNYFGEILLWLGVAIASFSALQGWQLVALISPVFVYLLLTKVSGVPLLEAKADKKWGDDEAYQAYKANTPVLVPKMSR